MGRMSMTIDYIKTPLSKYTFSQRLIREWVEENCEGRVLNLFAGATLLNVDETRVDSNEEMPADYHMDALAFLEEKGEIEYYNTVLLDPPYSYRKSMEKYDGHVMSPFKKVKDHIKKVLVPDGIVITFGYHSVSMGKNRGFEIQRIALFSHGGAIHDTIATKERRIK